MGVPCAAGGSAMQLKRCSGAIWPKHLPDFWIDDIDQHDQDEREPIELYYNYLEMILEKNDKFLGGAIALERGTKNGNLHIQYYLEHKPMRLATIGKELGLIGGDAISTIKHSAQGAYDYCAGLGEHKDKEGVEARFIFGEVKCWGSGPSGRTADLNGCVELIVAGNTPFDILRSNPYAYAVHRKRIWDLYDDLRQLRKADEINQFSNKFSDEIEEKLRGNIPDTAIFPPETVTDVE